MSDDFFSDPSKEAAAGHGGRDPREYPIPEEWVYGKPDAPAAPRKSGCGRSTNAGAMLLIFAGVIFFLNNSGVLHIGSLFQYWPLFLIAVGISKLAGARGAGQLRAIMTIGIGALFLARNLGLFWISFGTMWPLILIGTGVLFFFRGSIGGNFGGKADRGFFAQGGAWEEREVHLLSFFSGVKRVMDTDDFRGGDALAIFGGVDIDLRLARMSASAGQVVIDANAVFGGVNVKVPDNWRVSVRGMGVFGGYVDKTLRRRSDIDPNGPLLVITGFACFGGVEVQS